MCNYLYQQKNNNFHNFPETSWEFHKMLESSSLSTWTIVFVDYISQVYAFVTKIIGGKLDEKLIWWHRWLVNNCQPERYTSKKQKSSTWFTCNRYNIFKRLSTQLSLLSSTTRRVKLYTSIANRIKFQKFFCLLGGEELSTKKKRKQKK